MQMTPLRTAASLLALLLVLHSSIVCRPQGTYDMLTTLLACSLALAASSAVVCAGTTCLGAMV